METIRTLKILDSDCESPIVLLPIHRNKDNGAEPMTTRRKERKTIDEWVEEFEFRGLRCTRPKNNLLLFVLKFGTRKWRGGEAFL